VLIGEIKYEYQMDKDDLKLFDQVVSDGIWIDLKKIK